jgi:aminoglycoside phosphotransferase (APT) family kinase protein
VASTLVAAVVLGIEAGGVRLLAWLRATPAHRRRTRRAAELLPALTAPTEARAWTVRRSLRTVSDMAVATIGPPGQPARALVKLATSPAAARSLARERRALSALYSDERLGAWRDLLPDIVAHGVSDGSPYLVERLLPGQTGTRDPAGLVACAASAIVPLHRTTTVEVSVAPDRVRRWVDAPLDTLARHGRSRPLAVALDRLGCELWAALLDRRLAVSWIHGDFVPGNILVAREPVHVTGIVDWELARRDDLPLVDIVTLLLAARMHASRRELGRVVCDWLAGAGWTADERRLIDAASSGLPGEAIDGRTLVLLCWLRHVSGNLAKASRYATGESWQRRNVRPVAEALARS